MNTNLVLTAIVALTLPACGGYHASKLGIPYVAGVTAEESFELPADIDTQLDSAWNRAVSAYVECAKGTGDINAIKERLYVYLANGPVAKEGKRYYGLTYQSGETFVAVIDGRSLAAAHEFFHSLLGGDDSHNNPCWHLVDGDTVAGDKI